MTDKKTKTMAGMVESLRLKRQQLAQGGGADRLAKQKEQGKLTARERIAALVDEASFEEFGLFAQHRQVNFGLAGKEIPADGVVTGAASVDGRLIHLASQDFTVMGGSAGEVHSLKVADVMQRSLKTGSPFVFINDSGGARVQEGIDSLSGYGQVFYSNVLLSGAVPQISLICGPCAGGAAYSPALTDFIIQTRQAQMFITGPQVIKQVTGEDISAEALGGADAHMAHSGVIHFVAEDDNEAIYLCRRLLSFLPSNNLEEPPRLPAENNVDPNPALNDLVPVDPKQGYDVRSVIAAVVDRGDFLEVQAGHAMNMVVGFARILGRSIGIIANQPLVLSGAIDINAANKAARFIRFCNAFNIPMVTFVDVPGYLPGVQQEYGGIIRNGAKLLFAYSAASVPKIQIILRKSYGGAHVAMCSKDLGADCAFAWPTAEVAVMGAEGAVEIVFRKEMQEAADKAAKRAELIEQYRSAFASPYVAAGRRLVDDIIEPANTRKHLAQALEYLQNKRDHRPPEKTRIDSALTFRARQLVPRMQNTQKKTEAMKSETAESTRPAETVESLRAEVVRLSQRIALLEKSMGGKVPLAANPPSQSQKTDGLCPDLVLAISAAIAAYLGVEPHIRQIRLLHSHPWGQQGRVTIQASHRIRVGHG